MGHRKQNETDAGEVIGNQNHSQNTDKRRSHTTTASSSIPRGASVAVNKNTAATASCVVNKLNGARKVLRKAHVGRIPHANVFVGKGFREDFPTALVAIVVGAHQNMGYPGGNKPEKKSGAQGCQKGGGGERRGIVICKPCTV